MAKIVGIVIDGEHIKSEADFHSANECKKSLVMSLDLLKELLGCYFHQDWPDEFSDDASALSAIVENEPMARIEKAIVEIIFLLGAGLTERELRAILVDQVGCFFEPSSLGLNYTQWLERVRILLKGEH
jgi:hypothetical protein